MPPIHMIGYAYRHECDCGQTFMIKIDGGRHLKTVLRLHSKLCDKAYNKKSIIDNAQTSITIDKSLIGQFLSA